MPDGAGSKRSRSSAAAQAERRQHGAPAAGSASVLPFQRRSSGPLRPLEGRKFPQSEGHPLVSCPGFVAAKMTVKGSRYEMEPCASLRGILVCYFLLLCKVVGKKKSLIRHAHELKILRQLYL